MYNGIKNGSDYTKQMFKSTHNRILTFPVPLLLTRNTYIMDAESYPNINKSFTNKATMKYLIKLIQGKTSYDIK